MEGCVFCKIVTKQEVSYDIYEDGVVKAFLARFYPISEGHALVVLKKHYESIYDIPDDVLERMVYVVKKVALSYKKSLNANAVNIVSSSGKDAKQDVMHFHIHIIPRYEGDVVDFKGKPEIQGRIDLTLSKIKRFPIL